jgi:hypothetical protein
MPDACAVEKHGEIMYAAVLSSVDAVTGKVNNDRPASISPITGALPDIDLSLSALAGAAMHHDRSRRTMPTPAGLWSLQATWRTRAIFTTPSAWPGIAKRAVCGQNEAQAPGRSSIGKPIRRINAPMPDARGPLHF